MKLTDDTTVDLRVGKNNLKSNYPLFFNPNTIDLEKTMTSSFLEFHWEHIKP